MAAMKTLTWLALLAALSAPAAELPVAAAPGDEAGETIGIVPDTEGADLRRAPVADEFLDDPCVVILAHRTDLVARRRRIVRPEIGHAGDSARCCGCSCAATRERRLLVRHGR